MAQNSSDQPPPILVPLPDELRGERILLRPYRPDDGANIYKAIEESRAALARWMDWVGRHTDAQTSEVYARQTMARWLTREDLTLGLWEFASGRFLGGCGLHNINWKVPSMEIGYWLRSSAEGHGYMSEAVRLLCALAFDTLHANRVSIRCDALNIRSASIPRRLGFSHEGTLRHDSRTTSGELRNTLIFAVTQEEYRRLDWGQVGFTQIK